MTTDTTPAVRLQAWLDGQTDTPSKYDVRAVLWDLAEARTERDETAARLQEIHDRLGRPEVEWTVAIHGRSSVQYGDPMTEDRARNEVREEREVGAHASVASRMAGEWRHEDQRAQAHREYVIAAASGVAP